MTMIDTRSVAGAAVDADAHAVGAMNIPAFDITIFVPCLNEEQHVRGAIEAVVEAARRTRRSIEILVFDDNSTDNTADVVQDYIAGHPGVPVTLIRNRQCQGLATNFVEGAFRGRGRYYRMVVGDNVDSVESHVAILNEVGRADVILPSYVEIEGRTRRRWVMSKVYTWVVNKLSGNDILYYNGGPVVLRHDVQRYHVDARGIGFQAEFVTRLLAVGRSYREVPLKALDREGSTALTFRNLLSVVHSFVKIGLRDSGQRHRMPVTTQPDQESAARSLPPEVQSDCPK